MKTETQSHRLCRNILLFTFGGCSSRPINRVNPIRSRHLVIEPLRREDKPKGWSAPVMNPAALWRMIREANKSAEITNNGLNAHMQNMGIPFEKWEKHIASIRNLPNVSVEADDDEWNPEGEVYREVSAPITNEMQSFAPEYTEDYAFSNRAEGQLV